MSRKDRQNEIGKIISDAMRSAEGVDWAKDGPEIAIAQAGLEEAMALYADGEASKPEVRTSYRTWKDLHSIGGLF